MLYPGDVRSGGRCRAVPHIALLLLSLAYAANASAAPSTFEAALARGPLFAWGAALLGGLLVSLTPCVYPMIAITVSIFGANRAKSRLEAAGLSAVFVLGIATLFTALGVATVQSGNLFGSFLSNKFVVVGIALVFLAMAASMFGAFELALPSALNNRLATVGGLGYRGAFVLGLVSALVAAPCTGPALTGILLWLATTKNLLLSVGVMFTFAVGLGIPFFLVGTFAISLPKGGPWMVLVKWAFGVVMAVVALYFLRNAVPALRHAAMPSPLFAHVALAVAAVGALAGLLYVRGQRAGSPLAPHSKWLFAVSIPLAIGGSFAFLSWELLPKAKLEWVHSEVEGSRIADEQQKPRVIDFGAEWCTACVELDAKTFSDEGVRTEAGRFVAIKVDATDDEDQAIAATKDKYKVVGLPTVILIDSHGAEKSRFNEFVPPDQMLKALQEVD